MRFMSLVRNSFGCSASGERLVSAAMDGDLQEAKALLEYNPRLIVSLLIESGVDIDIRNYHGQTALMQACQYGHWEVVQTLILYNANIHRADYLNGETAFHLAALNGHPQCIRLLLADYVPSIPNSLNILQKRYTDETALREVINRRADGGITALHMAALHGHSESVQLLLDLGASVTEVTIEDGTASDLIGAGSTPLHYAVSGGHAKCCQLLVAKGASLTTENANRECGWRSNDLHHTGEYPCVVCLERKCTVASEGCAHEFCSNCALSLCSMNCATAASHGSAGSIACPLCRHGIVSFVKLPETRPVTKPVARTILSFQSCIFTAANDPKENSLETPLGKPDRVRISPLGSSVLSLRFQRPSVKFCPGLCLRSPDRTTCPVS